MPNTIPLAAAGGLQDPRVADYVRVSGRAVFRVEESRLATPALQALWRWWCSVSGAGVPERRSFDIAEHPSLAANLYLIERVPTGFRLRLAGGGFEQMFNRRKGHEWLHDAPEPMSRAYAGYFGYVVEAGEPCHSTGRLDCEWSDWFRFESLVCPLRHDGKDELLGVVAKLPD